jgi:hypothetical protein
MYISSFYLTIKWINHALKQVLGMRSRCWDAIDSLLIGQLTNRKDVIDNEGGGQVWEWETCFLIDGAASEETKIRHDVTFPLLTLSTAEKIVYNFLQDLSKRKHCLYRRPADCSYEKPMRYRELWVWCMMVPNKCVILGQELDRTTLENREFGHNARSATSRFNLRSVNVVLWNWYRTARCSETSKNDGVSISFIRKCLKLNICAHWLKENTAENAPTPNSKFYTYPSGCGLGCRTKPTANKARLDAFSVEIIDPLWPRH